MREYHKIHSVFKRDERGRFTDEFSLPEIEYLKNAEWVFDEKIDGTNIRVFWDGETVQFGGRTDKAQIPAVLVKELMALFPAEKFRQSFEPGVRVTLYGEGYGKGIQKAGANYIPDAVSFVLFDVMIGDWMLETFNMHMIAMKLGINVVPIIGQGTLADAIRVTRQGIESRWGDFPAEGMVLRPLVPLFSRKGERIITKLKTRDFENNEQGTREE